MKVEKRSTEFNGFVRHAIDVRFFGFGFVIWIDRKLRKPFGACAFELSHTKGGADLQPPPNNHKS